jgi:hypothetical protein
LLSAAEASLSHVDSGTSVYKGKNVCPPSA